MHLEAMLFVEPSIFKIDSSLHFLMDSGDANLIQEIYIERTGYTQVLNVINLRSDKHRIELQDKFEELNKTIQKPQNDKEYEAFIGERLTAEMKSYTEQIVDGIEKSIDGNFELIQKLHTVGTKIFPKEKIQTVEKRKNP